MNEREDIACDSLDLFLEAQDRAREEHDEASTSDEKAYWQGVKDGLRKCYAIFSNNPRWQQIGATSNRPDIVERI